MAQALEVIDRPIDNTALSTYMTCPQEYNYAYHQHRRSDDGKSAALSFGTWWHNVLETHYKSGADAKAVEEVIQQWEADGGALPEEYRTPGRLRVAYEQYRRKWNVDRDLNETVGFPDNPLVEISTAVQAEPLIHPYAGKLDRVIVSNGLGYIEDHKTTSRLDRNYFRQWKMSPQMMGYTWMGQKLYPSIKIVGVRINLLHVLKSKSDFHREIITFTDPQLEDWAENTNKWLRRLAQDIEANDFPMHFGTNGCKKVYGMCQYAGVCGASPRMRQSVLESEFPINPWNPLADEDDDDA